MVLSRWSAAGPPFGLGLLTALLGHLFMVAPSNPLPPSIRPESEAKSAHGRAWRRRTRRGYATIPPRCCYCVRQSWRWRRSAEDV